MRKESRAKLSKLIEQFKLVEKVVPELPKIRDRLRDMELTQWEFKGLYKDFCLKDEMN